VYFFAINRNKKSVTVNLKHSRGKTIVRELVRQADVLIENFKPGTMEDLALGYDTLRSENPRLVYCAISGFGASGPDSERAGYDSILQGVSGLMSITGERAGPPAKCGVAVIDEITALYAHGAILAALRHRDRTGRGQRIECSLLESGVATMMNAATAYLMAGLVQGRWGSAHETVVPYQAFRARDGYLIIGVGNERLWKKLCAAIGAPEWADDPRLDTNGKRVERRDELVRMIEERLQSKGRDEWIAELAAAGLPTGPINTVDQVFADPQVLTARWCRRSSIRRPGA
jgi:crotonobetainyl-CoA:carnitine CoA-transferase CaiB-like acyl-CoA transferase